MESDTGFPTHVDVTGPDKHGVDTTTVAYERSPMVLLASITAGLFPVH